MNQSQIELSDETLRRFALGLLEESEAIRVAQWLSKDPQAAARAEAIEPDSFLRKMSEAGRDIRVTAMESTSVDSVSAPASQPPATTFPSQPPIPNGENSNPNVHPELAELKQYQFFKQLGAGGMSLVFLAENQNMGRRKEALKILNESQMRQMGAKERFDQEIAVAAQLHHPNIVTAFNSMRLSSLTVFAMQYVEGQDLDQYVRARGAMRIATACAVIRQVAAGLQYAMEMRTIHRDIKPANLMLTKVGAKDVVKILDFGLAKAQMETEAQVALTSTGMGMGTPQYMAPEQLRSAATVDIRADIYSLGCTLYFLLTGKPPFTGSQYEIFHAHQTQEPPSLNVIRPDVPEALAAIVAKMMAKEPSNRFQRPDEVAAALTAFLNIKGPVPTWNQAGASAGFVSTAGAPPIRQVTQIESVPHSTPLVNAPQVHQATHVESVPLVTHPAPRPNEAQPAQPAVQTAPQLKKPVSWQKLVGGGLVACVA